MDKIHFRKIYKVRPDGSSVVRISGDALHVVDEIYDKTGLTTKEIVSKIIVDAYEKNLITFDEEERD